MKCYFKPSKLFNCYLSFDAQVHITMIKSFDFISTASNVSLKIPSEIINPLKLTCSITNIKLDHFNVI